MPKRSTGFQQLVALIHASLHDGGTLQESAMMADKITGVEREVDVLISKEVSGYRVNIALEIVDRARKADSTWVESMCKKHEALATDKLVLVSRSGFYRPALKKAQFYGAETITLTQASQTDWDLAVRMTSQGFFQLTTTNYKTKAQLVYADGTVSEIPIGTGVTVFLPYRDTPTDVQQMIMFFLDQPDIRDTIDKHMKTKHDSRIFTLEYTTQPGTYILDEDRSNVELNKLWIELEVEGYYSPIEFAVARYKDRDFAVGTSSDSHNQFVYVLVHDEQGDRGMLLDTNGLHRLTVDSR